MNKFSNKLINDMWNSNVRFDTILHIPTLTISSSERVSDEFQDFLESAYEESQSTELLKQCPALESTLKEIRENENIQYYAGDVAQEIYKDCGDFEFLIQLETRIPFNFNFDENGKYQSNSLGGAFRMHWILAKSMVHAAEIAIEHAEGVWNTECEKAKQKKGFA